MNGDDRPDPDARSALQQIADARATAVNPNALTFGAASPFDRGTDTDVNSGATGFDSTRGTSR